MSKERVTQLAMVGRSGFTLTDMLAGLLILGLAMVGFGQGLFALSRLQASTTDVVDVTAQRRSLQVALNRLFRDEAALGEAVTGNQDQVRFACGISECVATLRSGGGRASMQLETPSETWRSELGEAARFVYVTDAGPSSDWPLPHRQLIAVQIEGEDGRVLAYHRLWRRLPLDCAFDPVSQQCVTRP